ncbi:unnamed protein product [Kuraishia capsulata CBS 1993]|uniref:Uncharacterized protein n=1 Tax=Kuraishia capsulata CBS 1993 TaxID=1382522 RepID=W6MP44_9ASCO|nr:uncharacterized protein KUCA_T00004003001 [Kuraishia capsulata CBS 1993]CDK28023.1 unnamed protein product [Kuraishia capsulata CBS 1993]
MSEEQNRPKYAFVTGASSGIGYAISIELAERGFTVFAGARGVSKMQSLKKYGIIPLQLDVGSVESVKQCRDFIASQTSGYLDLLYNNAGVAPTAPAIEISEEALLQSINVNFVGVVRTCREFSSLVIKAKGTIAFTSSTAGVLTIPFFAIYGATKAAVDRYADGLETEMRPFGVTVVNVVTGGVETGIEPITNPLGPESRYYLPETLKFLKSFIGDEKGNTLMDVATYAKRTVEQVLNRPRFSRTWKVYEGYAAVPAYYITTFLPDSLYKFLIDQAFGFRKISNAIVARSKKPATD